MRVIKLGAVSICVAVWIGACTENKSKNAVNNTRTEAGSASPRPTSTIDELASGLKVYEQNCAVCHRADGTGGKVEVEGKTLNPDNLTSDKIRKFSDEKIIGYIVNGIVDEGMPSFKDKLSEGEIRDVLKFVRTQFHKK